MTNLLANVLGGVSATVYVGFLAYSLAKPALIVIVIICLALMAYALYLESRNGKSGG